MGNSFYLLAAAAIPVLFAFLASVPHRELDWNEFVLPMARSYAGRSKDEEHPLSGKVVVITGATSGIGLSLTKKLSRLGAKVVALGRSASKLASLQNEINSVETVTADLVDLESVANAARKIIESYDRIDILVNNAGIHEGFNNLLGKSSSKQGYDLTFGVNYLSHFLLTEKLASNIMNSTNPMIVQVSSSYHWVVDGSDLRLTKDKPPVASQKGGSHGFFFFRSTRAYANSKLAQILHARALKRHHPLLKNARIVNVCPAWVGTDIQKGFFKQVIAMGYDVNGWGVASILFGMFDTKDSSDFYTNTELFHYVAKLLSIFTSHWMYQVGIRDLVGAVGIFSVLFTERLWPEIVPAKTSPESYDETLGDALYEWSMAAVRSFL